MNQENKEELKCCGKCRTIIYKDCFNSSCPCHSPVLEEEKKSYKCPFQIGTYGCSCENCYKKICDNLGIKPSTQEPMEWAEHILSILDQKYVDKEWVVAELDYLIWLEVRKAIKQAEERSKERYNELIYAVGNKYPNETRHETALRYIKQAELNNLSDLISSLTPKQKRTLINQNNEY